MKDRMQTMARLFRALGDAKRLKIIKMLASQEEQELCVTDVARKLRITQPAASQHIRVLRSMGILEENRKGYRTHYTISDEALREYKAQIDALAEILKGACAA